MISFEKLLTDQLRRGRGALDAHFRAWMFELRSHPEDLADTRAAVKSFLLDTSFTRSLVRSGVTVERDFIGELRSRSFQKFFPPVYEDRDFASMLHRMEAARATPRELMTVAPETLREFLSLVAPDDPKLPAAMRPRLAEAMEIMAVRIASQGLSRQLYDRLSERQERSAFLNLGKLLGAYLDKRDETSFQAFLNGIGACVSACRSIRRKRESEGISLDLTYRLIIIQDTAARLEQVARIHWGLLTTADVAEIETLLRKILNAELKSPGIRDLLSRYLGLVFFQITEHTGKTGEKYIARDATGYWQMLRRGLIGGAIVGAFALAKPWVSLLPLAPAGDALAYGLIYTGIFLAIHFAGGVLATKQPAMTASRFAHALDQTRSSHTFLWELSDLVILTFRTQTVAVAGNAVLALPVACIVYLLLGTLGWDGLPIAKVEYLVKSLHPLRSLTVFYAAVTGIVLSLSGIFAGAATNWFVYNRIGRRLEKLLVRHGRAGAGTANRFAKWLDGNVSYLAGNVVLGVALGALPIVGEFFGLPLDVRHITFTSAQLGSALGHLGVEMPWRPFAWALVGILVTGAVNLTSSFALTLYVVLKSRNVTFGMQRQLINLCLKRFLRNPLIMFVPVDSKR